MGRKREDKDARDRPIPVTLCDSEVKDLDRYVWALNKYCKASRAAVMRTMIKIVMQNITPKELSEELEVLDNDRGEESNKALERICMG